jgi:hypothetical protein
MTSQTTPVLGELFDGGPPRRLETALRLVKPDKAQDHLTRGAHLHNRLGAADSESFTIAQDKLTDLLLDFAVHGRCLVAVLLFILAQQFTLFTLGRRDGISEADLIRDQHRPRSTI